MAKRLLAVKNLKTPVMCGHPIVERSDEGYRCLKCLETLTDAQVKLAHSKVVKQDIAFAVFAEAS